MRAHQIQREQYFTDPRAVSQQYGYSSVHLEQLLKLGNRLQSGSSIGPQDRQLMYAAHPNLPRNAVDAAINRVNAAPTYERGQLFASSVVAPSAERAGEMLDLLGTYRSADVSTAVEDRLDAQSAQHDRALGRQERQPAPPPPRGTEVGGVRDLLKRQFNSQALDRMGPSMPTTDSALRNHVADRFELAAGRLNTDRRTGAADAGERTLRDTISDSAEVEASMEFGREAGAFSEDASFLNGEL